MSPPHDEALAGGAAQGFKGDTKADPAIVSGDVCLDKSFASLQASAALAGCGLYALACGGYVLTRWGHAKECPDLRAVGALLARMGGAR